MLQAELRPDEETPQRKAQRVQGEPRKEFPSGSPEVGSRWHLIPGPRGSNLDVAYKFSPMSLVVNMSLLGKMVFHFPQ